MRYKIRKNRGFTLIEILVVMAISVILMGLVMAPVIQSFALTRRAQAMVDAQDAAREAMQMISREMGQAMYVFDNASDDITPYKDSGTPSTFYENAKTPIMLPVAQPNSTSERYSTQWFVLPYAKIDFILPKLYMHCNNPNHPSGEPRDYPREKQVTESGKTRIELYSWPDCPYCTDAGKDATDVEARPKLPMEQDTTVVRYFLGLKNNNIRGAGEKDESGSTGSYGWVSPWGNNVEDGDENQVVLYRAEFDPRDDTLFPPDEPVEDRLSDPIFFYRKALNSEGVPCYKKWAQIAEVVGIGNYEDLVKATTDSNDQITAIEPTVTFRTTAINNDTFKEAYSSDSAYDYPDAAPSIFEGTYGYWIPAPNYRVDVYRGDFDSNDTANHSGTDYYTKLENSELIVFKRVWEDNAWKETPDFNISQYLENGYVPADSSSTHTEMAFLIDENHGTVKFALNPPRPAKKSITEPVATLDQAQIEAINTGFEEAYRSDRGSARRALLLPTFDDTNTDQYIQNARIVPGSERIIGPNMRPGADYGKPVRYERVPLALGDPSINQYKIDYDSGELYFSSDPNEKLPEIATDANTTIQILVYYKIHFNLADDVVRGDYSTKSLINIHMGMRIFDPNSAKAHLVELNGSIKIRNALR